MNLFQYLVLVIAGMLLLLTFAALARGWATRREAVGWAVVWSSVAVAVAWPNVTVYAARKLGIGRGADLVMYCAVVVMMVGFLMVYVRLRRLRREITLLVRHLALREASGAAPSESEPRTK